MKQLIIAGNVAYGNGYSAATGTLNAGSLALLSGVTLVADTDVTTANKELAIAVGNANNKIATKTVINAKGLSFTKSVYSAATYTSITVSNINVGTVTAGKSYGIMVSLAGQPTGARNVYTISLAATDNDTLATIVAKLVSQINASLGDKGIKASYSASVLTITGSNAGDATVYDFKVQPVDSLSATVAKLTTGSKAFNDAASITALYEECIGGNGIYDPEGNETGYVRPVISGTYTVYNLSYVNPREGKQTSYQNVIQNVMIAIPTGAAQIATLEAILGKLVDGTIKLS